MKFLLWKNIKCFQPQFLPYNHLDLRFLSIKAFKKIEKTLILREDCLIFVIVDGPTHINKYVQNLKVKCC